MQRQFLLLTALLPFFAFGQHNFGIKINPGVSYFSTKAETNPPQNITQRFYPMPSGQAGFYYNYSFKDKFLIGTELLYVLIEGKEYFKLPFTDNNGNPTGEFSEEDIWRHISFVSVPVYVGYNFNKWNVNLGVQGNFVWESGGRVEGRATLYGTPYTWENSSDKLGINQYDYGIRAGVIYNLSARLSLEANYYMGLTNLIEDDDLAKYWDWRVQQLTVGVRFNLLATNVPSTESDKK